jgi:hypothetical protein
VPTPRLREHEISGYGLTITSIDADMPANIAVIVACPAATPRTSWGEVEYSGASAIAMASSAATATAWKKPHGASTDVSQLVAAIIRWSVLS